MDALATSSADSVIAGAMASSAPAALRFRADASRAELQKTAKDFESMFMTEMLKPMFESVEVNESFGGGHGEEMMRGMLTQEYGKALVSSNGTGLSDAILDELVRMQASAHADHGAATTGG